MRKKRIKRLIIFPLSVCLCLVYFIFSYIPHLGPLSPINSKQAGHSVGHQVSKSSTSMGDKTILLSSKNQEFHYNDSYWQKHLNQVLRGLKSDLESGYLPLTFDLGYKIEMEDRNKIILATTWRTGSTFLGEMMSQAPGTFYSFEPLAFFDKIGTIKPTENEKLDLIKEAFACEMNPKFFNLAEVPQNNYMVTRNLKLWQICHRVTKYGKENLCFNSQFVNDVCQLHPVHLMKTTRIRLKTLLNLIRTDKNLKIVYLVRDPRGIFESRSHMDWCQLDDQCADITNTCQILEEDLDTAIQMFNEYPGQIHVVRFEDFCFSVESEVRKLMSFLGLPITVEMKRYVQTHTWKNDEHNANDPFGTMKKSSEIPFKWVARLSLEERKRVEKSCEAVMNKLGYEMSTNGIDGIDDTFDKYKLLCGDSENLWPPR